MSEDGSMERRRFLAGCGLTCAALACAESDGGAALLAGASPVVAGDADAASGVTPQSGARTASSAQAQPARRRYRIDVEIVECKRGKCAQHEVGQKFAYPADRGRMCAWLLDSMNGAVRVLEFGGTLPWLYEGTPYAKVIDPEGVTTEFIRCPDPTDSGVVAKITRTRV